MSAVDLVIVVFTLALGLCIGSFANVCIHRLPLDESIVSPPSRCPSCRRLIAFYDNVPVLAWLVLRGKCRMCGTPISARYPAVEAAVGLIFLSSLAVWGPTLVGLSGAVLGTAALILVFTDLEHRILPDEITLGALGLGLLLAGLRDYFASQGASVFHPVESHLLDAVGGAALGASLLFLVRVAYGWLQGTEGMGLGDVTMIAMVGAFTGVPGVLLALFFASFSGSLLGGGAWLLRTIVWGRARAALRAGESIEALARRVGLLVDAEGRVLAASPAMIEIPGFPEPGTGLSQARETTARPLVVLVRLARRRARAGKTTGYDRLRLEDDEGDFFRVLAVRADVQADQSVLVYTARSDIPFGVFLALGSIVAFVVGRRTLDWLFGGLLPIAARVLP